VEEALQGPSARASTASSRFDVPSAIASRNSDSRVPSSHRPDVEDVLNAIERTVEARPVAQIAKDEAQAVAVLIEQRTQPRQVAGRPDQADDPVAAREEELDQVPVDEAIGAAGKGWSCLRSPPARG
jgi:hypothetical protein